jgi:hypothetical protein
VLKEKYIDGYSQDGSCFAIVVGVARVDVSIVAGDSKAQGLR